MIIPIPLKGDHFSRLKQMIRLPRPASAPYLRPVGAEVQSGTMNLCSNSFFLATK